MRTADDAGYAALFDKLERERGFRGSQYRQKCLKRRVAVRMRARGALSPNDYVALLDGDPEEYDRLLRTLTINVSRFFRNPETWEVLRVRILPELLRRGPPTLMWSAGSAAGEEAYSLAILAYEWLAARGEQDWKGIRIVGTDIDEGSLAAARAAVYPDMALEEVPPRFRRRWFVRDRDWYLKPPIPSLVEFHLLDILEGQPEFQADLILCRNLLIYLDRTAQDEVFRNFVQVLRPGGYLVLGRVETLSRQARSHFEVIDSRERIYRKR